MMRRGTMGRPAAPLPRHQGVRLALTGRPARAAALVLATNCRLLRLDAAPHHDEAYAQHLLRGTAALVNRGPCAAEQRHNARGWVVVIGWLLVLTARGLALGGECTAEPSTNPHRDCCHGWSRGLPVPMGPLRSAVPQAGFQLDDQQQLAQLLEPELPERSQGGVIYGHGSWRSERQRGWHGVSKGGVAGWHPSTAWACCRQTARDHQEPLWWQRSRCCSISLLIGQDRQRRCCCG